MMNSLRIPLRIVFYKDDGDWIAHCLEFNLLGDGPTKNEAVENVLQAITIQLEASFEFNNPSNLFTPADGRYLEMFSAGTDVAEGEMELRFQQFSRDAPVIERVEAREYLESGTPLALV